jgi:hypothetical protein
VLLSGAGLAAVVLLVVRAKVFEPRRRQFGVAGHKAISDAMRGSVGIPLWIK